MDENEPIRLVRLSDVKVTAEDLRINESAYRRGFNHAMSLAGDLVREGATADDLDALSDELYRWRYDGSTHTVYMVDAHKAYRERKSRGR